MKGAGSVIALILAGLLYLGGCDDDSFTADARDPCTVNSDCELTLICSNRYCREPDSGPVGSGGMPGAGGTGGFTATIVGDVRDRSGMNLEGVFVRAIIEKDGTPVSTEPQTTDEDGFEITVTEPGEYELCAIGVIEVNTDTGPEQRFVSTNCEGETATVERTDEAVVRNLSARTGYYMSIKGPRFIITQDSATMRLMFDYQVWNRRAVSDGTTRIVLGIEDEAQEDVYEVGNAGPDPGREDRAFVDFTPDKRGPIFARLIPVGTDEAARTTYKSGFEGSETTNYVQIGTVE